MQQRSNSNSHGDLTRVLKEIDSLLARKEFNDVFKLLEPEAGIEDFRVRSRICTNLGRALIDSGDYPEAVKSYYTAFGQLLANLDSNSEDALWNLLIHVTTELTSLQMCSWQANDFIQRHSEMRLGDQVAEKLITSERADLLSAYSLQFAVLALDRHLSLETSLKIERFISSTTYPAHSALKDVEPALKIFEALRARDEDKHEHVCAHLVKACKLLEPLHRLKIWLPRVYLHLAHGINLCGNEEAWITTLDRVATCIANSPDSEFSDLWDVGFFVSLCALARVSPELIPSISTLQNSGKISHQTMARVLLNEWNYVHVHGEKIRAELSNEQLAVYDTWLNQIQEWLLPLLGGLNRASTELKVDFLHNISEVMKERGDALRWSMYSIRAINEGISDGGESTQMLNYALEGAIHARTLEEDFREALIEEIDRTWDVLPRDKKLSEDFFSVKILLAVTAITFPPSDESQHIRAKQLLLKFTSDLALWRSELGAYGKDQITHLSFLAHMVSWYIKQPDVFNTFDQDVITIFENAVVILGNPSISLVGSTDHTFLENLKKRGIVVCLSQLYTILGRESELERLKKMVEEMT
jgi:tetratricopeptide (TPR) repeat protein